MKYRAVLFDMDGVLIDARDWHYEALNQALKPFDLEISRFEHENEFDGLSTKVKLEKLVLAGKLPRKLVKTIEAVKQDRTLRIAAEKCFPNIAHQILLARLKKTGLKIGVVTNSIRDTSEFMLKYANVYSLLDTLVTNQDILNPKPAPDGYLLGCQNLNFSPKEVLVVEDGEYGTRAAIAAGCEVLRVKSPEDVCLSLLSTHIPDLI